MKRHLLLVGLLLLCQIVPATAQQPETPEGSFVYEIAPGQDILPLGGNRYELIIPKIYFESVTSGAGQEAKTSLSLILRYKGIDTTRDYILYDEVSGNQISKFTLEDKDKAHVNDGVILLDKPNDSLRLKIPLDQQTARAGKLGLSLRGLNRQETYDLEKKCGYAILKPQIELKTAFAKYRATVTAQADRYSLALTVDDFNLGYVLSTLDKRDEGVDVSRRGASFDLPFSPAKEGVREAGFCIWPRFSQAYEPDLLAKDILCETFVSSVNRDKDLAEVQKALPEVTRKLPPENREKIRLTTSNKTAPPEKAESGKKALDRTQPLYKPQDKKNAEEVPADSVKLRIRSDSDPGDSVRVNGQNLGPTPAVYAFAKGKQYTVELRYSRDNGGGQKTYTLDVGEGKITVRYKDAGETESVAPGETWELWLQVKKDRGKEFRLVKIKQ